MRLDDVALARLGITHSKRTIIGGAVIAINRVPGHTFARLAKITRGAGRPVAILYCLRIHMDAPGSRVAGIVGTRVAVIAIRGLRPHALAVSVASITSRTTVAVVALQPRLDFVHAFPTCATGRDRACIVILAVPIAAALVSGSEGEIHG